MNKQRFKLNNKNYKEVEYIVNNYIKEQKQLYKNLDEEEFYVEITFCISNTMAVYEEVDEVKILEWNDGLRIFMYCREGEHSFYYQDKKKIYAEVEIDALFGCGNKKCYFNNVKEKKYSSKTIYFRETSENTY